MGLKLKRYLLFAGETHYPSGGWGDFRDDFDDLVEAEAAGKRQEANEHWWHVVDTETREREIIRSKWWQDDRICVSCTYIGPFSRGAEGERFCPQCGHVHAEGRG